MLATNLVQDSNVKPSPSNHELQRTAAILRIFPSLTDFAFLAPLFVLFLSLGGVKTMLGDGDTGWHIRAGEWMLANGRVPTQDLFSYTMSSAPWFAWEWLADVILALVHQWFGLAGPVYLGILLLCVTSAMLFRLCRRQTDNDLVAIAVTGMALAASSIHWLARPHLFSFLFLVISLHILDRARTQEKMLWFFPPLVALWANLHGAFFVAIIILVTVGVGVLLQFISAPDSSGLKSAWKYSRVYFISAIASSLASLLNPYGWNLHLHIYKYLTERYHFEHILEYQSISFHSPLARYFEALIVLGVTAAVWSGTRRRLADTLIVLSWLHLSLVAARHIPIFVFVSAPIITRFLSEALISLKSAPAAGWVTNFAASTVKFGSDFSAMDRIPRWNLVSALGAIVLFVLIQQAPAGATKFRAEFDPKVYPAGALHLLAGKRVFTNDEWGDYLIYRLYPNQKVFIDGRSDFYGPEFSLKYIDVLNGKWDWAATLAKHGVDAILLPVEAPMVSTLKASTGWKPVYDDHYSILFFAEGNHHEEIPGGKVSFKPLNESNKPDSAHVRSALGLQQLPTP